MINNSSTNKARPVYLDLFAFKFPITAIASILHRISGVLMFFGLIPIILLWHTSLQSESGFDYARGLVNVFYIRLFLWAYSFALFYHILAGIKHLIMDLGWGESIKAASIISWSLIALSLLFGGGLGYLMFFV